MLRKKISQFTLLQLFVCEVRNVNHISYCLLLTLNGSEPLVLVNIGHATVTPGS